MQGWFQFCFVNFAANPTSSGCRVMRPAPDGLRHVVPRRGRHAGAAAVVAERAGERLHLGKGRPWQAPRVRPPWPACYRGLTAAHLRDEGACGQDPRHRRPALAGRMIGVDSAATAVQICAEFFPEEGIPPRSAAVLQELFGWSETPRVARGRVPILLHILGPNNRPVQITDDLKSFWSTTYHQVRKDLRRRYPKHAWPEDPLQGRPPSLPRQPKSSM